MDGLVVTVLLIMGAVYTTHHTAASQRTGQLSAYRIASFQNPDPDPNTKLNHFTFHNLTGNVYIGAVNSVYQLNNSLALESNISTAVDCMDDDDCFNHNKVIFVEPMRNVLITCESENGGMCQQRDLGQLVVTSMSEVRVSPGKDKTTVSLLAPGPRNIDWLYVASTYTRDRDTAVPLVTRRNLGLNLPNNRLLFQDSQINTNRAYRSQAFDINYVYGFASNGFTYFVTAQQSEISNTPTFISKVVRVCHTSENLDAYTEITLRCDEESNLYNLAQAAYHGTAGTDFAESLGVNASAAMLYVIFARNVEYSNIPSDNSALCAFSMTDIENAFFTAVQNCVRQGADYSVGYLDGAECKGIPSTTMETIRNIQCEAHDLYQYANNPVGVGATPLLQLERTRLTSIITSIEINHTVAFIGTSQGLLLKVHLENGTFARHFETVKLGDSPVLTDICLHDQMQQIHVLTEQQLLRLKVENCKQYSSCETCIGENGGQDGDPYCGWCTLQNKCTKHSECPMAGISSRWLPYNAVQCIGVSDINPSNLAITDPQQMITLTVEQLPDLIVGETYSCRFNDLAVSQGTTTGNLIRCMTPETSALPRIPEMEDHVTLNLSVFSSETNLNFITSAFNFYNCSRHKSCTECVMSDWDCDWCVYDNRCTHKSNECTPGDDIIITGNNNSDITSIQGPTFCPQLQRQAGEELVPVGVASEIRVNVFNLPNAAQLTKDYQCTLMVEDTKQNTPATVLPNDVIQCNSRMYSYIADRKELVVQLYVTWNGEKRLDDPDGFNVTLYKCHVDRQDCSRCLSNVTARPELECRWCGNQCAFRDNDVCIGTALDPRDPCPAPTLVDVDPETGPIEGNTIIEITGTNIGRRFQDVRSVMVGQQSCDLTGLEDQYITGRSVQCRTAPMSLGDPQRVTLSVAAIAPVGTRDLASTGNVKFTYKDPMITRFSPNVGPEDGGTMITITGSDMNTGRDIQAMVATSIQCDVVSESINNTAITCRTGNSTKGIAGPVSVTFDGALRSSVEEFTYQPNPNVTDINPRKSVLSGGRTVNVTGQNFIQIQTPMMTSTLEMNGIKKIFKERCSATNDTHMTCVTPDISSAYSNVVTNNTRRKRQTVTSPIIGFIMADVSGLLMWSETQAPPEFEFSYVEAPIFDPFPGEGNIFELDSTKLTIRGQELSAALTIAEVKVFIGTEECKVDVFDNTILSCEAPEIQPDPLDYDGNQTETSLPAVYVNHSRRYIFIGFVRYLTSISIAIYIGIPAALILVTTILILYLWLKLRGSQKEIGAILIQMDELEKGIAEDLRIAFAELQTNVTDLTHDLAGTGMPFVSHRQYAANMLFIGLDIQPETSDPHNLEKGLEGAMVQFNKLLVNKNFLLAFIQSLDDDKKIPVKDKATIASLLTVIMMLEDKLGYLTDIMITLMSRQVQAAVDNNRPKQLFRRTESIVEKLLSNWIAICLYDQLKDHTAFPLFLLYSGIKVQTEKGPVDAITRQAHFSLSEERLLKGNVEFNEMTLHVVVDSEDGERKEVKVLNVDAVPQVKEKILDSMYRNRPYSDRQRAVDVNVEWRQGNSGRLTLQDVAVPQIVGPDCRDTQQWQKLNTLEELGVPDHSLMALVPKKPSRTSINEATSGAASYDASLYRQDVDLEDGATIWHLEKPQEEIEESEKQKKKRRKEFALGKGKKSQNITFPRLLTMKGIVQEYVDKMFHAILTVDGTPLAIKYLFDFFDSQASRHGIEDPDISHIWKSNTLPLRFWVSAITHPNYIFDIRPTPSVESSLGVVGQAFYDSCNKSDHQLGWESSFSKLLYNREVNKYRGLVESYYEGIGDMTRITTSNLDIELDKTCKNFTGLFSKLSTLLQLYEFTKRSKDLVMNALEEDEVCERDNLGYELEQVEVLIGDVSS